MKLFYLPLIVLLLFNSACQKEDEILPEPLTASYSHTITTFTFLKDNNPTLPEDITAKIIGNNIYIELPKGANASRLIASFATLNNSKVFINGEEQISGKTPNNFTSQVLYNIVAQNGHKDNYEVELKQAEAPQNTTTITPDVTQTNQEINTEQDFSELDAAVKALLQRYNIPGAAVAITKNEKLVYVQNYGHANKESNVAVNSKSLFRIASISKPITAIGILKLVQDKKISLNQKVFGPTGILGLDYGIPPIGSGITDITVQHLLDHKAGWDNTASDPMFSNLSLNHKQIITDLVVNQPLKHTPGTTFLYSNIGYCILGRIIEKVTGKAYTDYITSEVLNPMGITDMKIARNTLNQQLPNEVTYYQPEWSPYNLNLTRMDASGGWVATAADLMRFMVHIDRNNIKKDLVETALLKDTYLNSFNWTQTGSLPGTAGILTRLNNEYNFVILTNSKPSNNEQTFFNELNTTLKEKIKAKSTWPQTDLFSINM
ncbi:serine hydrolase domain-containing protein [Adhaeribacter aquaticus]|uniref:serine hydrolase domain-containing protein n=1 Tax=Adhaeribacter aquaticus TaxID=299567 RepID=UPI0003F99E38|nr:serine hydrolase domain-containing protein [Adhaeribacter aquaticus]